ncbi:hypothetical protein HMPREF1144_0305 [Klebsiella sp. OBRC7]|uniref:Uncharacterized protein n=1 Tax=Raoultella ornithinolytica TaxID=54291 RepID=A0A7G9A6E2_RAOOR|nr:hypothetical protein HMPREF1144_0305 [Klebsiella sp. OBRC7]QNL32321.1 Hypothetical protein [Raoultella ornithinolytica]
MISTTEKLIITEMNPSTDFCNTAGDNNFMSTAIIGGW